MRIGFVVNDVDTEQPQYTTTRLALAATRRGHDVWLMGVGDFAHRADGSIGAKARAPSRRKHRSLPTYLGSLQQRRPRRRRPLGRRARCHHDAQRPG